MIPGSVSRVVEGKATAGAAGVLNLSGGEVFRLGGSVTYNTINPPLGGSMNQVIWLIPIAAGVILGTSGNIAAGLTLAVDRAVRLIWLKSTQKWYIENGA